MKEGILIIILAIIFVGIIGFAIGQTIANNRVCSTIDKCQEYYIHTENMLNAIYNDPDSLDYYRNVVIQTEAYHKYKIAKDLLNSEESWEDLR